MTNQNVTAIERQYLFVNDTELPILGGILVDQYIWLEIFPKAIGQTLDSHGKGIYSHNVQSKRVAPTIG